MKYFTIVAIASCCCCFFISTDFFISGHSFDHYGWNKSICLFQSLIKYMHLCEIQCVCAYESHFKWIWNFVDFWDDVICYRFELRSYFLWPHHMFTQMLCGINIFCFLFRFVFCLLAARCTSFFVSSSYSLYNYFCQHDQIFLKFRTDDDQNIVVNEKEKNKGEKKQHLHVPNKISLLNFWKWKNSEWQMNAYIIFAKQKPMTLCAQSDRKGQKNRSLNEV